jgi:hypothetical protein
MPTPGAEAAKVVVPAATFPKKTGAYARLKEKQPGWRDDRRGTGKVLDSKELGIAHNVIVGQQVAGVCVQTSWHPYNRIP